VIVKLYFFIQKEEPKEHQTKCFFQEDEKIEASVTMAVTTDGAPAAAALPIHIFLTR
jgi:hypothetical protein